MTTEHVLYRYFAENGDLLYIGISVDAYSRAKQHRDGSKWWPDAASVTFEKYPNRDAVSAAERLAIKAEKPIYNKVHNAASGKHESGQDYVQNTKHPLVGLYGFELHRDEAAELDLPGPGFRVEAHITGDQFLVLWFKTDHFGSLIVRGVGMKEKPLAESKQLRQIGELKNPHFFDSFREMVTEHRDWVSNYEFFIDKYFQRRAREEKSKASKDSETGGAAPLHADMATILGVNNDAG